MIPSIPRPIPDLGFMTAWVSADSITVLCRSADWYKLSPIKRYLMNMTANDIRMEDARTEARQYTYARWEHLRRLHDRCEDQPWETAWEANLTYGLPDLTFGVVHLVQETEKRGDRLIGDDPDDFAEFMDEDANPIDLAAMLMPSHGVEGSDV